MGFLDFLRSPRFGNNYTGNESYSTNEYDEEDGYDDEYDEEEYEEEGYANDEYSDNNSIYLDDNEYNDYSWENYPRRGHDFWDTIENLMEDGNYAGAEDFIKNYFRKEEKDIFYYFAMAYFYSRQAETFCSDDSCYKDIQRAKSHIDNAINICDYDTKWPSLIEKLKLSIYQNYYAIKEEMRIREDLKKEWADLRYQIRYPNMDIYLPLLRNLAQNIRQQLSNGKISSVFLNTVESDLRTWENTYCISQIKKLAQEGNLDEAIKMASGIKDTITQEITMTRLAAMRLHAMISDGQSSRTAITHQIFMVEDALRRVTSLAKDNDDIGSLRMEVQEILDNTKKSLDNRDSMGSFVQEFMVTSKSLNKKDLNIPTKEPSNTITEPAKLKNAVSESESEYIEELKACLKEGPITDKERRLFDRLRKSMGISETRAAEFEAMCKLQALTAEEQEYADELKACFEDSGEITAKERRLLDRLSKSLGIDPERANQIEQMIK